MQYQAPDSFAAAVSLLNAEAGMARVLAGGTDVLVQLRSGAVEPDLLVDIKRIPGVFDITAEDGGWRIGAAVTGVQLNAHAELCADWPGVAEAHDLIGSTQVQGRATLTGNLCTASPAADSVPAMAAAGATARVQGPDGVRDVAVENVGTGPFKVSLARDEVITSIFLPARGTNGGDAYLRFIPRTEMDIAVVGAAVSLTLDGDKIASARVSLGAVAPTVVMVEDGANAIIGTTLDDGALDALAAAASAACNPISDKRGTVEFRTRIAGVLAKRAAKIAYDRAKG